MTPYYTDDAVTLWHGDCLEVLATLTDASVDAVVTDPPYGLEFMGKEWDSFRPADARIRQPSERDMTPGAAHNDTTFLARRNTPEAYVAGKAFGAWCELWSAECLRVLKPGGHMLAFGGTRTWHRLACAVEDAGFEVRDSIAWLYGSGFPKSLDVSKAIDRAAGAEREVVGKKSGRDAYGYNPERSSGRTTGAIRWSGWQSWEDLPQSARDYYTKAAAERGNITAPATDAARQWQGWGTALKPAFEPIVVARKPLTGTVASNVMAYGTGALNITACRVGAAEDKRAAGTKAYQRFDPGSESKGTQPAPHDGLGRWPANVVLDDVQAAELDQQSGTLTSGANPTRRGSDKFRDAYGEFRGQEECIPARGVDSGGASRFFPVFRYEPKAPTTERPRGDDGAAHPTVKPLDLMRWLVRLVTPPPTVSCENGCRETKADGVAATLRDVRRGVQTEGQSADTEILLEGMRGRVLPPADEALPPMRHDVSAGSTGTAPSGLLLEGVLGEGIGAGEAQGSAPVAAGLRGRVHAGSSDGDEDGLHPSAPSSNGGSHRADAQPGRGGASQERDQDRQPTGEPRSAGEGSARQPAEATAEADRVPALRGFDRVVGTCPNCKGALVERGGVVLDCFLGSGTTAEACIVEGFRCIGVERDEAYLRLAAARLAKPIAPVLFGEGSA